MNSELLSTFINVLDVTRLSESHLFELKKNQKNESILKYPDIAINNPLNNMNLMFEPSQLVPIINDKCESLKIVFRSMRDILNNLRPHQTKQAIITLLQQQLLFKQNKLKLLKQNIINGEKIINQQLNINRKQENESDDDNDDDLLFSTNDNHTQQSMKRLKQSLDESFFN